MAVSARAILAVVAAQRCAYGSDVRVGEKRSDGSFQLNGVEYIVPIDAWKSDTAPTVMGQPMKRFDRAGFYYLHAWIWKPSPTGLFADWNPDVTCPPKM